MRDQFILDRKLGHSAHDAYFRLDGSLSSGLKKIIGDVKNANNSTVEIVSILNKNVNTEKYVDIDFNMGIPLPFFSVSHYKFLPNLFFSLNYATSMSFFNKNDILNPKLQIYIKNDLKIGARTLIKIDSHKTLDFALYQLQRSDIFNELSASDISESGKLFDLNDLSKKSKSINADLSYQITTKKSRQYYELQEIRVIKTGTNEKKNTYKNFPLMHVGGKRFFYHNSHQWTLLGGLHFRTRYSILEGAYIGGAFRPNTLSPFHFLIKINSDFLAIHSQIISSWAKMSYRINIPYMNPQDEIWVSTIHTLSLTIPF